MMNLQQFTVTFTKCLRLMCVENHELLDNKLKEECINAAFCWILKQEFSQIGSLQGLHYDIEYDQLGRDPKTMDDLGRIRPDILIHRRTFPERNFLFIEAKKGYFSDRDRKKLVKALKAPYSYVFSVGLSYLPNRNYFRCCILHQNEDHILWKKIVKVEPGVTPNPH